jgi:hypothetical protein
MDEGRYDSAYMLVKNSLWSIKFKQGQDSLLRRTELNCMLIDIGTESNNKDLIEQGLQFLTNNESVLKNVISTSSYFYNIANAKSELGKIFYRKNPGVHSYKTSREIFQEPINLYWVALKAVDSKNDGTYQKIIVNLANALTINFRLVEAIQFLDTVLKDAHDFPQALVSKADHLTLISNVTNCPATAALYSTIYNLYNTAYRSAVLPSYVKQKCYTGIQKASEKLLEHGFELSAIDQEQRKTTEEYNMHSDFRKFTLDNFLSLNEHAIYCKCIASSKDDLQIGTESILLRGKLVPRLELLLNRVKSEFAFARWSYYRSLTEEAFDYDVVFSNLYENEIINSQSETLRTAFRVCYGILDKIALGICKLYGITGGSIYFERFWDDKNRVQILEQKKNIHLNALSSIANDLNSKWGELKHFKNWRNKLEHNLLILQSKFSLNLDPFSLIEDDEFVVSVDIDEFKAATLQLLQLTRAAIFSYVYCIRLETIVSESGDDKEFPFIKLTENRNSLI